MSELLDFLQKSEIKEYIQGHVNEDINKLLLNPPSEFKAHIKEIVGQIQARQKAKGKLDSWTSNFDLICPPPISVEQASSDKTAHHKKSIIKGKHLVDLTGGMGIDCLALSKNFKETTYVEKREELTKIFEYNCQILDKKISIVSQDAVDFLKKMTVAKGTDVTFFIDPARRDDKKNKVFKLEDCTPNILELIPLLKEKAGQVLIKLSPLLDITSILNQTENVKEVHVVSVKNECKELLILIDFSFDGESIIKTINFDRAKQTYRFKLSEESEISVKFGLPERYLFESNVSILKAGAFKKIGVDFDVRKLHTNTHVYTSDQPIDHWPGRTFEIVESDFDKKGLKKYAPNGFVNVLTRNYPIGSKELKKKFSLKDGGDFFLIGFKDLNEKARLVIAKRS